MPLINRNMEELVGMMRQHHAEEDTGTLFVVTGDNRSAKLVFHDGQIVAVSLRNLLGMDALQLFPSLQNCKFRFSNGIKLIAKEQALPRTKEIFDLLLEVEQETLPLVASVKDENEPSAKPIGRPYKDVLEILSNAAIEHLGPIAIPLCKEYFPPTEYAPQMPDLVRALNQLGIDINNSHKHQQLVETVQMLVKPMN